jgi:hypothetical protein
VQTHINAPVKVLGFFIEAFGDDEKNSLSNYLFKLDEKEKKLDQTKKRVLQPKKRTQMMVRKTYFAQFTLKSEQ